MKEITQYQSEDGKIFPTSEEALAHETLVAAVNECINALGLKPINISGGQGYVQHDPEVVKKIRTRFHSLALKTQGFDSPDENGAPDEHFIGRWLNDSNSFLYGVWHRLYCIDNQGREFDQQYFVAHPEKAKLVEVKC